MTIKYYGSPFHGIYDEEIANKIVMKIDLSIMISALMLVT